MAEEKEILIKISADIEELKNRIDQATSSIDTSFKKVSQSVQSQGQNIIQMFSQLAIALQLVGQLGASLDVSFKEGFKELRQIDQYSNLIQKFNTSFQTPEIENYIQSLQRLTGFSDTELRNAFTRAVIITKDVSQALEILGISADIASAGTIDLSTVAWSLAQVSQGVEYGVRMLARQLGIAKAETEDVDKLLSTLRDRFGGLASEIQKSTTGAFTQYQLALTDLKEEFGKVISEGTEPFYRAISNLTYKISEQVTVLKESDSSLADFIKTAIGVVALESKFSSAISGVISSIVPLINTFLLAKMAGGSLGTTITTLGGSLTTLLGPVGVLLASLPAIIPMLSKLTEIWGRPEEADKTLQALASVNDILTYKIPSLEIPVKPMDVAPVEKSLDEIESIMIERGRKLGEILSKPKGTVDTKDLTKTIEDRGKAYEDYVKKVYASEIDLKNKVIQLNNVENTSLEKKIDNLERIERTLSWAKAELIGPSNIFMAELTGFSFAKRIERREITLDVYLRNVSGVKISQSDAENIGRAIASQIKALGM